MIIILSLFFLFIRKFLDLLLEFFTLNIILKFVLFFILFNFFSTIKKFLLLYKNEFPDHYILTDRKDHIINIIIIFIYPVIFIFGILYLRVSNMNKTIDLLLYFNMLKDCILNTSKIDVLLVILLLFYIFKFYILIFRFILKVVKFHIIKRHIYFSDNALYSDFWHKRTLFRVKISFLWQGTLEKIFSFVLTETQIFLVMRRIRQVIFSALYHTIHYLILLIVFLYDIIFNNYIVIHIFVILPVVFIYNIWLTFRKFEDGTNSIADNILYHFFYSSSYLIDESCMQLGPLTVEVETLKKIYMFYIKTDLVYDYELEKYYEDPENYVRKETFYDKIHKKYVGVIDWLKEIYMKPLQ